jgi:hypothetical protein
MPRQFGVVKPTLSKALSFYMKASFGLRLSLCLALGLFVMWLFNLS